MADFDFVIPLSLRALEEPTSNEQYVVTEVLTAWEVASKIKGKPRKNNYWYSDVSFSDFYTFV